MSFQDGWNEFLGPQAGMEACEDKEQAIMWADDKKALEILEKFGSCKIPNLPQHPSLHVVEASPRGYWVAMREGRICAKRNEVSRMRWEGKPGSYWLAELNVADLVTEV